MDDVSVRGMPMSAHVYNSDFYDYIGQGSRRSAERIVPLVASNIRIGSVLDIGAGNGAWAAEWLRAGIGDLCAVDGAYVDVERLQIPRELFRSHDLTRPLQLGRRFDLVQTLEVAEHLPARCADDFVKTLIAHGDVVLFSAAVPHQGGEHHVNEQPPEYWRRKFADAGYSCFDWLRPLTASMPEVKPWYRFNTLIYANEAGRSRLSEDLASRRVPDDVPVPMRGDFRWKARRVAVSILPRPGIHMIAMIKAKFEARTIGRRGGR